MNQYLHQKLKAKITENLETVDRSSCGSWKARVLQVFKNLPSSIFLASHYKLSYLHSECVFCLLARIVRASSDSKLRHWSGKKKENRTLSCFSCVVSHLFTFDPSISYTHHIICTHFSVLKMIITQKMWPAEKYYRQTPNASEIPIRFAELIWKLNFQKAIPLFFAVFISVSKWRGKNRTTERTCLAYIISDIFIGKGFCLCCVISDLINGWRSLSDDSVSLEISY